MTLRVHSDGPADTAAIGEAIAAVARPGQMVVLHGEVGAGKTTLVRSAARALGVEGPVTSPTFTLANVYRGTVPILHIDAYRLGGADDEELGLLLDDSADAVTFVEWPGALGNAAHNPTLVVTIEHGGADTRLIALASPNGDLDLERIADHLGARHIHRQPEPGAGFA